MISFGITLGKFFQFVAHEQWQLALNVATLVAVLGVFAIVSLVVDV